MLNTHIATAYTKYKKIVDTIFYAHHICAKSSIYQLIKYTRHLTNAYTHVALEYNNSNI